MKKSEKLLDAIGQIDDKLVEEASKAGRDGEELTETAAKAGQRGGRLTEAAAKAGRSDKALVSDTETEGRAAGHQPKESGQKASERHKSEKGTKKKTAKKRTGMLSWQRALAACAVLAICVSAVGLLSREGLLLGPSKSGSAQHTELTMDTAGNEAVGEAEAVAEAADEAAGEAADGGVKIEAATDTALSQGAALGSPQVKDNSQERNTANDAVAEKVPDEAGRNDSSPEAAEEEKQKTPEEAVKSGSGGEPKESGMRSESAADQEICGYPAAETQKTNDLADTEALNGVPDPAVVVSVKESGDKSVTFTVENKKDQEIWFGKAFELERLVNESWQTVIPEKEVVWDAVAIVLGTGDSYEETIVLDSFYGKLPAGQYRLVKSYMLAAGKEPQGSEKYPIYVEFTVSM